MQKLIKTYLILLTPLIVFFIFPKFSFAFSPPTTIPRAVPFVDNNITYDSYLFARQDSSIDVTSCSEYRIRYFAEGSTNPYFSLDNTNLRLQWGGYSGFPSIQYIATGDSSSCYFENPLAPTTSGNAVSYIVKDYPISDYLFLSSKDVIYTSNSYDFGTNYGNLGLLNTGDVVFGEKTSFVTIPENNTVDFPAYAGYVPTGETTLTGQCKNPGENYILLTRELSDVNDYYDPDITCQNDYTWSVVKNTNSGGNSWFLYDFVSEEWVEHFYYGTDSSSLIWSLGFQYPQLDSQNTAKVVISESFPFRARYTIESANFEDVEIHLDKCTDSTFSNCSTEILNNTLPYFDEDKTGYFEFSLPTVVGYEYYDFYMVNDSIVTYSLKFRVLGSSDSSSQLAILPDKKDLGYWGNTIRDFVMPPYGYFEFKINNLKNVFYEKFAFINQIRNSINARASTPSDSSFTSPTINFLGNDYAVIGAGTLDAFLPTMRNILTGLIYFLLSVFVIRSVSKIINT